MLSIIIPHYNSSESLEYLLLSIPNNRNVQTIVVDDGSNKEHSEKLSNLQKDFSFELYSNCKGKGAGGARNVGLLNAKGRWVLFADSDDYFHPDMWQKVEPYFETGFDVVFFTPRSVFLNTNKSGNRHATLKERISRYIEHPSKKNELDLRFKFFPPWSKMIRRRLITENEIWFDEIIASNDVLFSSKVGLLAKKIKGSAEEIYVVTQGPDSLTMRTSDEIFEARKNAFIRRFELLREGLSKEEFRCLDISGFSMLVSAFLNYGVKHFFRVLQDFSKYEIPFFSKRDIDFRMMVFKVRRIIFEVTK